ncbi:MAG: PAS domain-containing protein [Acidimicrobiia bacterium]
MPDQQPIELIMLRQLASYLAVPFWIMDQSGTLLYYNEPAEELLGIRFDDAGPLRAEQLSEMFTVTDLEGKPIEAEDFPLLTALMKQVPSHRAVRYRGMDGVSHKVDVTAMPVWGQGNRFVGAFAAFWESED